MNTLFSLVLIAISIGGLIYYWWKARLTGVYWFYILFVTLFWPIGSIIGIYWALEDLHMFYRGKPLIKKSDDKDSKYSLKD